MEYFGRTYVTSFPWSPILWSITHVKAAHDSRILINPERVKHSMIPPEPSAIMLKLVTILLKQAWIIEDLSDFLEIQRTKLWAHMTYNSYQQIWLIREISFESRLLFMRTTLKVNEIPVLTYNIMNDMNPCSIALHCFVVIHHRWFNDNI